jgi:uncharacterized membrane protein
MFDTWSEIYSNSAVWRTVILYAHIGGILVGGGCAVAADRLTLLAAPADASQLKAIAGVHRIVIAGLTAIVISGLLMLAADLDTFIGSRIYWTKMALVVLLLINGLRLTRAERAARGGGTAEWMRLRRASQASLALWLLIALFGAMLPNV